MTMDTGTDMATATRGNVPILAALGTVLGAMVPPAWASDWQIVPSIFASETVTDNVGLSEKNRESDWITDIAPS